MLPQYAVKNRNVVNFVVLAAILGGILSYINIGRLEDPEFTVKKGVIVTVYPGASAYEVEQNVTDVVERTVNRVKNVDRIKSWSRPGLSLVLVELDQNLTDAQLSDRWSDMRNKMKDIRLELPAEALSPIVQDDFGQVYGVVLSLCSEGFTPSENLAQARRLQRSLSMLPEVGRVELWGQPEEYIEITLSRARLAELAIPPTTIVASLVKQNLSANAGNIEAFEEKIRLAPTGRFQSVEEIGDLLINASVAGAALNTFQSIADKNTPGSASVAADLIASRKGGVVSVGGESPQVRLRDIAEIRRVELDPPSKVFRFNGQTGIAIAISPRPNGNVTRMGEQIEQEIAQFKENLPLGYSVDKVAFQPDNVQQAIHGFIKCLYEAVIIVSIVVMLAMGWRSGIMITSSLIIVFLATMCLILPMGIVLQRISLGAFIIALGILVDNAVVVGDLISVRMSRGMERVQACVEGTRRTAYQLLGATIVGILAFLPVYLVDNNVGEYCKSLFIVIAISLTLSWLAAMLHTPVLYMDFAKNPLPEIEEKSGTASSSTAKKNPHGGTVYRFYRSTLNGTLGHPIPVLTVICIACVLSGIGFRNVDQTFFPRAQRTQFMIDFWLPEGSTINAVEERIAQAEVYLRKQKGVVSTASFLGAGPPRFYLPYEPQMPNSSYGQIVVNVQSLSEVDQLLLGTDCWLKNRFPEARVRVQRFAYGIPTNYEIEARFCGPDPQVLRQLGRQAESLFRSSPLIKDVDCNWRQKALAIAPEYSQQRGQRAGISRSNVAVSLGCSTQGVPVGFYNENVGESDTFSPRNIPIVVRANQSDRHDIANVGRTPVWGTLGQNATLDDLVSEIPIIWEDNEICHYNRVPAVTIGADGCYTSWMKAYKDTASKINAIALPEGYSLEWGGQKEESNKSTAKVLSQLPLAGILMLIVVVALFNDIR